MKEKFYIENYSGDFVMHCPTEEAAEIFTKHLHNLNRCWRDGSSYENDTSYKHCGYETCYNFNNGTYGRMTTYRNRGYAILEFEDFRWVEDEDFEVSEEEILIINTFLNNFKNN